MQVTNGVTTNIDWKRLTELNVHRTRSLMEEQNIDALLVATIDNWRYLTGLPLYYMPIKVKFHKEDNINFDALIDDYVRKNKRGHQLSQGTDS